MAVLGKRVGVNAGATAVGASDGVDVAGSIDGAVVVGANVVGSNDGGVVANANAADVTSKSSLRFRVAIKDGLSEGACP